MRVLRIGTFFIKRIKPSVIKSVRAVTNGISITGDISNMLILKPSNPWLSVSKTMTWKKKMGRVFALIVWVNRLSLG